MTMVNFVVKLFISRYVVLVSTCLMSYLEESASMQTHKLTAPDISPAATTEAVG